MNNKKKCLLDDCENLARIKFCSDECKDRYHNIHNPRGKFAHLKDLDCQDHPMSGEAIGQD